MITTHTHTQYVRTVNYYSITMTSYCKFPAVRCVGLPSSRGDNYTGLAAGDDRVFLFGYAHQDASPQTSYHSLESLVSASAQV